MNEEYAMVRVAALNHLYNKLNEVIQEVTDALPTSIAESPEWEDGIIELHLYAPDLNTTTEYSIPDHLYGDDMFAAFFQEKLDRRK